MSPIIHNECNNTFVSGESFLSLALFEMGRKAPRTVPSDVCQIRLDQHRL